MDAKSSMARSHIRKLVLDGTLIAGARVDIAEVALSLKTSAVPVREALIGLSERLFIKGGSRQTYHISKPSQVEQLEALTWATPLFRKAIERFRMREDRAVLASSIRGAIDERASLPPSACCFLLADAIGKVGLSEVAYLLFSITLDTLLLAPPIDCDEEYAQLRSALDHVIAVIVDGDDRSDVGEIVETVSRISERIISLAHTHDITHLVVNGI